MTQEKPLPKTNVWLHLFKLIVFDMLFIWVLFFCCVYIGFMMLFGAGANTLMDSKFTQLGILTLVYLLGTIPFYLFSISERSKLQSMNKVKLANYKLIIILNTLLLLVLVVFLLFN